MKTNPIKTYAVAGVVLLACASSSTAAFPSRSDQVLSERQHIADLGNGYYQNPIISGNLADPSVIRVDQDYYMVHSKGTHHAMIV